MKKIKNIYIKMKTQNVNAVTFNVDYNRHKFSCIFILGSNSHQLYLTTIGKTPKTICVEIGKDFTAPNYLGNEEYTILANYLEFEYGKGNRFKPIEFFKGFDNKIDVNNICIPKLSTMVSTIGKFKKIDEEEKIYFVGWKRNATNCHVSDGNYKKTSIVVGEKVAQKLRISNVSSCWSEDPSKENIFLVNSYKNI